MFRRGQPGAALGNALRARWVGESVNSLLPAGQIGGPVLMVRYLAQRGTRMADAAATVTVSTTMQALAQMAFALIGIAAFSAYATHESVTHLRTPALIATGVLGALAVAFYARSGAGCSAAACVSRRSCSAHATGRRSRRAPTRSTRGRRAVPRSREGREAFALSLVGWIVGTAEVWLALHFLGHPVSWLDALLLESVGQAIRGAAFAIPGSLGAQEGGYLLLAPLVGLPPDAALALSLASARANSRSACPACSICISVKETGNGAMRRSRSPTDRSDRRLLVGEPMRAIILAAGLGLRLQQPPEAQFPKCLLRFDGVSLLERHLRVLDAAGVDEIVLGLGFQAAKVEQELKRLAAAPRSC
jgi:putative membrane protein